MRLIVIIGTIFIFSSCSVLIQNQGFKNYKSEIRKTDKYKNANIYQKDILYLDNLCVNSFPDIEKVFPSRERIKIRDSLINVLESPDITKNVFNGCTRFYLSQFKNQHTAISGLQSKTIFPYFLYPVNNSWYLWDINKGYDSLQIGQEILTLAGKPMSDIENILFNYVFAENPVNQKHEIIPILNRPDLLKQFSVIEQTDSILLEIKNDTRLWVKLITQDEDLNFTHGENRFRTNPITKYNNHNYDISLYPSDNYAYFQFNRCNDKIDTYETMREYLKLWIIPFAKMYINRQIKRNNSAKLQGYVDTERPIFKDYIQMMFDSINDNKIQNLIIDLRNNPGGSSLLCLQLLYHLSNRNDLKDFSQMFYTSELKRKIDKKEYNRFEKQYELKNGEKPSDHKLYPYGFSNCDSLLFEKIEDPKSPYYIKKTRSVFKGNIIVLADYTTGSAAALLTTLLQDNDMAIIIGTSVGNNPIGATTYTPFRLPETKFSGSIATRYLVRPKPEKGKVQIPDYWVENSLTDMINGKDKLFEKALDLINE